MRRSGPPARKTRLRAKRGARFPQGVNEDYREWIRQQPCVVTGKRTGHLDGWHCYAIEACHVRSRGAGGRDEANLVPLASFLHREQHTIGIRSFEAKYGIDLQAEAARLWAAYQEAQG